MKLCDINPFMRYAGLQPSVISNTPTYCSYDYRIFYIIEGNATFICSDKSYPVSSGALIYFRPSTPYYFDGRVKVIVLNFDMTRNQSNKKTPIPPSKGEDSFNEELVFENDPPRELHDTIIIEKAFEIEEKLQDCLLHYGYPSPFSDAFTSAIVKDILCYIAQRADTQAEETPETVQKIMLYIGQNYDREISNTDISNALGYHPFYLNRIFKKSTGMTIHQAVIGEKMKVAKRLLRETELSVKEIAEESGFSDRSQFCTVFKKHTGITPLEYRQGRA